MASSPAGARMAPGTGSKRLLALLLSIMLTLAGPVMGSATLAQDETAPTQAEAQESVQVEMQETSQGVAATAPPTEIVPPTEVVPTAAPDPTAPPVEPTAPPAQPTMAPTVEPAPLVPDTLACEAPTGAEGAQGWQFQSECTYVVNSPRAETHISATIVSATTEGWTVELPDPGSGAWGATGIVDVASVAPGTAITVAVRLTAPASSQGGEQATVAIAAEIVTPSGVTRPGASTTVAATIPQPAPTPAPAPRMQRTVQQAALASPAPFTCTGPRADAALPANVAVYDCAYYVDYGSSANATITFRATAGGGWDIGMEGSLDRIGPLTPSPLNGDGVAEISFGRDNKSVRDERGTVRLLLQAPGSGGGGAAVTLSQSCTQPLTATCAGMPPATFTPSLPTVRCADLTNPGVTAALTGVTLNPVAYSASPRTNAGSMTLTVQNPSRCTGWGVTISGTDLVYTGAAPNQATIPVENLRVTAPGKPAVPLSGQAKPIVTGGGSEASATVPLAVALDIPGGSAAGSYTTTVTVSTTSAP